MLVEELRKKSRDDLFETLDELKAQLFLLRFKNSTGQLEQPHKISLVKKDIAKVFTILNNKNIVLPNESEVEKPKSKAKPSPKQEVKKQVSKANENKQVKEESGPKISEVKEGK